MKLARSSIAAACLLLAATTARAGGIAWYEVGTPDVGTASAGRGALALDASTAWTNPAGMARLDPGSQLMLGFVPAWFDTKFEAKAGTSTDFEGDNGGQAGGFEPVISGFFTHTFASQFSIGAALVPSLSQNLEYGENFIGRYFTRRASLRTATLNPSVAFRAPAKVVSIDNQRNHDKKCKAARLPLQNIVWWAIGFFLFPQVKRKRSRYF